MNFIFFIAGCLFILIMNTIIPKILSRFSEVEKKYEVLINISYFVHPTDSSKKGEYIRMKPIPIQLTAADEEGAIEFVNQIVKDNIKVEVVSIEELSEVKI